MDTIAFNGHGTAAESLWAAVPVVTLPGDSIGNRVGAAVSLAAGQAALVARTVGDYVLLVERLLLRPRLARALKQQLREQRGTAPLWDIKRFACRSGLPRIADTARQVRSLLGALNAHVVGSAIISRCGGCVKGSGTE